METYLHIYVYVPTYTDMYMYPHTHCVSGMCLRYVSKARNSQGVQKTLGFRRQNQTRERVTKQRLSLVCGL